MLVEQKGFKSLFCWGNKEVSEAQTWHSITKEDSKCMMISEGFRLEWANYLFILTFIYSGEPSALFKQCHNHTLMVAQSHTGKLPTTTTVRSEGCWNGLKVIVIMGKEITAVLSYFTQM